MKPFFYFDTDEARLRLLSRARNVALQAIQQYKVDWNCIRFIQLSDAITYEIQSDTMGNFLLRIHSDGVNNAEIMSELVFLNELSKIEQIVVPVAISSRNGCYVIECETEEGYKKPYVSMLKWIEGDHLNGVFTDDHVYRLGVMIAALHEASAKLVMLSDLDRPHLNAVSFKKEVEKLEHYYTRFLSEGDWKLYQSAIDKIIHQLGLMPRDVQSYGLIHGDLHSGNVVFHNGSPRPIDFGRCGYGYYLYDVAASLLELDARQRVVLIQGYESVRPLKEDYIRGLELFFIMVMISNYCHHASDTREIPGLIAEQNYALAYITEFINERSFLLHPIEPIV